MQSAQELNNYNVGSTLQSAASLKARNQSGVSYIYFFGMVRARLLCKYP